MRRVLVLLLLLPWVAPLAANAEDRLSLGLNVGIFDTAAWLDDKGDFDAIEGGLTLRWPATLVWGIGPMAGISANDDGAFWLYAGLRRPFSLGGGWSVAPNLAVSLYEEGDGKDLGHVVEFRSGLELAFTCRSGSAVGLEFYHLSNASISDVNPGSNSLVVFYSRPLGR
ncbi:MAG: acyloxyacyl hydrolase [Thermoanaerobaculales bacterium]|nr:acyloxyacyl hydrolase [Thermoanaerobaculales bacterium]